MRGDDVRLMARKGACAREKELEGAEGEADVASSLRFWLEAFSIFWMSTRGGGSEGLAEGPNGIGLPAAGFVVRAGPPDAPRVRRRLGLGPRSEDNALLAPLSGVRVPPERFLRA